MTNRTRAQIDEPVEAFVLRTDDDVPEREWQGPFVQSEKSRVITDVVTPRYRQRIKAGEVINNPCTLTHSERSSSSGGFSSYKTVDPSNWTTYTGPVSEWLAAPLIPDGPERTLTPGDVKLACIAKMDMTEYAFGEDLGEIGQTVRFLKNPIKSLTDLALKFEKTKKRGIRRGKDVAKATADAYATYQWAFKPLVRSATDLAEALNTQLAARKPRYSARARLKRSVSDSNLVTDGTFSATYQHTIEEEVKATILYENHRNDPDLLKKYGLRFKDAPETAWQLFPMSFMIDRVVNISDVISASINLLDSNLRILAASTTEKVLRKTQYQLTGVYHPELTHSVNGNVVKLEEFDYIRSVWYPSASDLIPPVRPANLVKDVQSILDLTALITQRIL